MDPKSDLKKPQNSATQKTKRNQRRHPQTTIQKANNTIAINTILSPQKKPTKKISKYPRNQCILGYNTANVQQILCRYMYR